jgi:hypothetical protein
MIASAWRGGRGSVYGLRILGNGRWLYFRREWTTVKILLPDEEEPVEIVLGDGFWERSPQLRSPRLKAFFRRNGLLPWTPKRPPHFQLEPLGGGTFRLRWLEHIARQPELLLNGDGEARTQSAGRSRAEEGLSPTPYRVGKLH